MPLVSATLIEFLPTDNTPIYTCAPERSRIDRLAAEIAALRLQISDLLERKPTA